jgi:peptidoglycan/xylan/chitin deacetylase (PgdA/CDA1 family)
MEVLHALANPIRLEELVHAIENSQLPSKAVVVTFDDGYADNFYEGKPLLEHYEIPATVFITTGSIGSQFWWDEMEYILLSTPRLPERLEISFNDFTFRWDSENCACKNSENKNFKHGKHLLMTLYKKLLPMSYEARKRVITHLQNWSGFEPEESPPYRAMTSDELIQLVSDGLIDVGTHTVSHPILSELSDIEQRMEVLQGKEILEKILDRKVKSFSYPHGLPSEETMAIVRNSGFICACSSYNDVALRGSDPFCLPRFWVQDWDGKTFERWLQRWLNN